MIPLILPSALVFMTPLAPSDRYQTTQVVDVDVSPLIEQSEETRESYLKGEALVAKGTGDHVRQQLTQALEHHGVPLVADGARATVSLRLEWVVYLDSHYRVHIEVQRPEVDFVESIAVECVFCDDAKLSAAIVDHVPQILPWLEGSPPPPAQAVVNPVQPPPLVQPPPPDRTAKAPVDRIQRVGPAGWAGIAIATAGLGGLVSGVVVRTRNGEQTIADVERTLTDNDAFFQERDQRALGSTLVGLGCAALVTGAVLIAIDQTVHKRRRTDRTLGLQPSYDSHGGSVVLFGRF